MKFCSVLLHLACVWHPCGGDVVSVATQQLLAGVASGMEDQQQLVLFSFQVPDAQGVAPPQDLVIVLDISLSMAEQGKLHIAKTAISKIIADLRSQDRLSLVSVHGTARIEVERADTARQGQLLSILQGLEASSTVSTRSVNGGVPRAQETTDLMAGVSLAQQLLVGPPTPPSGFSTRRAMLFSDGNMPGGMTKSFRLLEAVEHLQQEGALTSVVALGQGSDYGRWLLESAAEAGRGGFVHLTSTQLVSQVRSMAAPSYFRMPVHNAELTLAAERGAQIRKTCGHRRRDQHRRRVADSLKDATVPIGTLRTGRSEQLLVALTLPPYRYYDSSDFLTYQLRYTNSSSLDSLTGAQLRISVLLPGAAQAAPWLGASLYYRWQQLLLLQEEIRGDEEEAEAAELPASGSRGKGSRWARLSESWHNLRQQLDSFAGEAAGAQRQLPSVNELQLAQKAWAALEMTRTAGRGSLRPNASFGVCEGAALQQSAPQGIQGLGY